MEDSGRGTAQPWELLPFLPVGPLFSCTHTLACSLCLSTLRSHTGWSQHPGLSPLSREGCGLSRKEEQTHQHFSPHTLCPAEMGHQGGGEAQAWSLWGSQEAPSSGLNQEQRGCLWVTSVLSFVLLLPGKEGVLSIETVPQ